MTAIPKPKKPTLGVLYYGNKQIGNPDTFRNLTHRQSVYVSNGYDKSLFHKHYYYGNQN